MKTDKVIPRIPSGFLELLPSDQIVFNDMFEKVKKGFEKFGYLPIETPAVELKDVLLAKGGGETEKQVYRLSNNNAETDLCLHFDLTVPLARYVSEHINELTLPFRRYQMQKVWRGERAQSGRYREFYQCDIDVIGTFNPLTDAEIPSVIYSLFKELRLPKFTIHVNNRKLLYGLLESSLSSNQIKPMLNLLDGLVKVGKEKTQEALISGGLAQSEAEYLIGLASFQGSYNDLVESRPELLTVPQARVGLLELKAVYEGMVAFGIPQDYGVINLGIVRGLDYYTGTVYETILDDYPAIGSICSGGRYDDLCKYYTDQNLPGVGISIGLSRLFYQLKEAGLLPQVGSSTSEVILISPDSTSVLKCMEVASILRSKKINCEVYMEEAKVGKQLNYANKLGIPFAILIGESEVRDNVVTLKDMSKGVQSQMELDEAISVILG